jgi:hypothetical protein
LLKDISPKIARPLIDESKSNQEEKELLLKSKQNSRIINYLNKIILVF